MVLPPQPHGACRVPPGGAHPSASHAFCRLVDVPRDHRQHRRSHRDQTASVRRARRCTRHAWCPLYATCHVARCLCLILSNSSMQTTPPSASTIAPPEATCQNDKWHCHVHRGTWHMNAARQRGNAMLHWCNSRCSHALLDRRLSA